MNIILDLKLLIYSYLDLTEVLIFFQDNYKIKDLIFERNEYYWPTWDQIFINNYYHIAEYLLQHHSLPDKYTLNYVIQSGNLEMLQLLYSYSFEFGIGHLTYSAYEGRYDIFIYLISIGVCANKNTYSSAKEGYSHLCDHNDLNQINNQEISSTEGYEKILDYLEKNYNVLKF